MFMSVVVHAVHDLPKLSVRTLFQLKNEPVYTVHTISFYFVRFYSISILNSFSFKTSGGKLKMLLPKNSFCSIFFVVKKTIHCCYIHFCYQLYDVLWCHLKSLVIASI